jgi:GH25 family lysozyme M1 (1,4-beta-N-acetylmuramidase)/nucleoid-associated protein YgaU/pimeloyl-ACP methyl ester carboxylesterase
MTGNIDALTGELYVGDYTTELTERQAGEVFDAKYYAEMNPDLASAGLKTPEQLYEHFQEFGIEEGRCCSPLVDLKYYGLSNPELAEAGLTTPQQLYEHLQKFGLSEGRKISPWVDLKYYLESHADLKEAFGNDTKLAFEHLQRYGVAEGRKFSEKVDLDFYLAKYADLSAAFGSDRMRAFEHWQTFGVAEGRKCLPDIADIVSSELSGAGSGLGKPVTLQDESSAPVMPVESAQLPDVPVAPPTPVSAALPDVPVALPTPVSGELPVAPATPVESAELPDKPVAPATPVESAQLPDVPVAPPTPVSGELPVAPVAPVAPATPVESSQLPVAPVAPATPVESAALPVAPVAPATPVESAALPVAPVAPATPVSAELPVAPVAPATPVESAELPVAPVAPVESAELPVAPVAPATPVDVAPELPVAPVAPATPISAELPVAPVAPAMPVESAELPVAPVAPATPVESASLPVAPVAPATPVSASLPVAPVAPVVSASLPVAPVAPATPVDVAPVEPVAPAAPVASAELPDAPVAPATPVESAELPDAPVAPATLVSAQLPELPVAPATPVESSSLPVAPVAPATPVDVAPELPVEPVAPATPVDVAPVEPVAPVAPAMSVESTELPELPVAPATPVSASLPVAPVAPATPVESAQLPSAPVAPATPSAQLPVAPVAPVASASLPVAPVAPATPVDVAPVEPVAPVAPAMPVESTELPELPVAPATPVSASLPVAPVAPATPAESSELPSAPVAPATPVESAELPELPATAVSAQLPELPVAPATPVESAELPSEPVVPAAPATPVESASLPSEPVAPATPVESASLPSEPVAPATPVESAELPVESVAPATPVTAELPAEQTEPATPVSAELPAEQTKPAIPADSADKEDEPTEPVSSDDSAELVDEGSAPVPGGSAGELSEAPLQPVVTLPQTLAGLEEAPTPPKDLPENAGGGNSKKNPAPKHLQFSTAKEEYYSNEPIRLTDAWVFDASGAGDLDRVEFSVHREGEQWQDIDSGTSFFTSTEDDRWGWLNYSLSGLAAGDYQLKGFAYDKEGGKSNAAVAHFTVSAESAPMPLIGVIDTGFAANNPDIDYSRISLGKDWVDGDDSPLLEAGEGNEHGTHILGIIGATQNNGVGIYGMNDRSPVWLGRAVGSGKWAESLIEFVDFAKASGNPNALVNLSLDLTQVNADESVTTRYEFTPREREALEYARQNNVLAVVAAGNDGDVMSVLGQASQEFDNIITAGAANGINRADYSSFGHRGPDIVAEGGSIANPIVSTVGEDVGTMAGTSVATAQVTGAASLVWEANPGLNYRQVIEALTSSATDLNVAGWDSETGAGLLNADAAVEAAKAMVPEVYTPAAFLTPTTWGGEGLVTPEERAASDEFNGQYYDWVTHTIQSGDSLSQIALDRMGDSSEAAYNFIAQHNGIADPNLIYAGQVIEIPTEVSAPTTVSEPSTGDTSANTDGWELYTVQEGDSLSAIAQARTGNASDYQMIVNYPENDIPNPDLIYPGQQIWVPKANAGVTSTGGTAVNTDGWELYTVKEGDSLSAIAQARTGNANDYQLIVNYPQNDIPNPDFIYPGQQIWVPKGSTSSSTVSTPSFEVGGIFSAPYSNNPWLGKPTSNLIYGGGVQIQYFENGHIIWNGSNYEVYEAGKGTGSNSVSLAPGSQGVDVSNWQGNINWQSVKNDGYSFAFVKASEGTSYSDPYFSQNWQETKNAGIVRGAYHFFHPNLDATAQANQFVKMIGTLAPNDLPPVLDLEVTDGVNATGITSSVQQWLDVVEDAIGRKPIIYTTPGFWQYNVGNTQQFADYPLWIANWQVQQPKVPGGWNDWAFWQYTDSGRVNGISGNVDLNRFSSSGSSSLGNLGGNSGIGTVTSGSPVAGMIPYEFGHLGTLDDTLWEIAQRELGDGNRWPEIRKSNGSPYTESEATSISAGTIVYLPGNPLTSGGITGTGNTIASNSGSSYSPLPEVIPPPDVSISSVSNYENSSTIVFRGQSIRVSGTSNTSDLEFYVGDRKVGGNLDYVTDGAFTATLNLPSDMFLGNYQVKIVAKNKANMADSFYSPFLIKVVSTKVSGSIGVTNGGESRSATLESLGGEYIENKPTWIVIHGMDSNPDGIKQLAEAIEGYKEGEQVLTFDWSEGAKSNLLVGIGASFIESAATFAAESLKSWGIDGPTKLNVAGHSLGAYVAAEIAERIPGGVNKLISLDIAKEFPEGYVSESIDLSANSQFSWGFYGSNLGSSPRTVTADESFSMGFVTNWFGGNHGYVKDVFAFLVKQSYENPNNPVSKFFALDQMSSTVSPPWRLNEFNDLGGNVIGDRRYEGRIEARDENGGLPGESWSRLKLTYLDDYSGKIVDQKYNWPKWLV